MNSDLQKTKEQIEQKLQKAQEDLDVVSKELEKEVQERLAQKKAVEEELAREERRLAIIAKQDSTLFQVRKNMQFMKDRLGDLVYDTDFLWLMICVIFSSTDEGRSRPETNRYILDILEAYCREKAGKDAKSSNPQNHK